MSENKVHEQKDFDEAMAGSTAHAPEGSFSNYIYALKYKDALDGWVLVDYEGHTYPSRSDLLSDNGWVLTPKIAELDTNQKIEKLDTDQKKSETVLDHVNAIIEMSKDEKNQIKGSYPSHARCVFVGEDGKIIVGVEDDWDFHGIQDSDGVFITLTPEPSVDLSNAKVVSAYTGHCGMRSTLIRCANEGTDWIDEYGDEYLTRELIDPKIEL